MKKTYAVLALTAVSFAAAALVWQSRTQSREDEIKEIRIGIALYRGNDPFINSLRSRIEDKAKEYEQATGIRVVLDTADPKGNQNTQNSQVERFLSLGCDALRGAIGSLRGFIRDQQSHGCRRPGDIF